MATERITFKGSLGEDLAARLEMPRGAPRAFALFAHCFSCSKDIFAATKISRQLADDGIAVLRFDFTGLGHSDGDFANTNFSSNVADLVAAANFMRETYEAPTLLIGHSLGGAAVLLAAHEVPECKAVVTLGAPADTDHVTQVFADQLDQIERDGVAGVTLGGRPFTIKKQFVDDLKNHKVTEAAAGLKRALLIMHAPLDEQVSVENATQLFVAAKHPKSFVSLDSADHLITRQEDATYAANVLCAWAGRYIESTRQNNAEPKTVLVRETGNGKWESIGFSGNHEIIGDQPRPAGKDAGPSPYDFVAMGLGLCTNQTLRMYAGHKGHAVKRFSTTVHFDKAHVDDCQDCAKDAKGKALVFERQIEIDGDLDPDTRQRMLEIADKCPVHKALEGVTRIRTRLVG